MVTLSRPKTHREVEVTLETPLDVRWAWRPLRAEGQGLAGRWKGLALPMSLWEGVMAAEGLHVRWRDPRAGLSPSFLPVYHQLRP